MLHTLIRTPSEKDLACTYFKVVYFLREWIDRSIHTYIKSNQILKVNTQYCSNNNNNNNNQLFSFFLFSDVATDDEERKTLLLP